MGRSIVETLIGMVVVAVAIGFGYFAYSKSSLDSGDSYVIHAKFDNVDGLSLGSDIRIGGIKVGVVSDQRLDPETYLAILDMQIQNAVKIPSDSTVSVVSEGLLGSKYVALEPGAEDKMLNDGDSLTITQSSINLESLLGKFIFGGASGHQAEESEKPSPSADPMSLENDSDSGENNEEDAGSGFSLGF